MGNSLLISFVTLENKMAGNSEIVHKMKIIQLYHHHENCSIKI